MSKVSAANCFNTVVYAERENILTHIFKFYYLLICILGDSFMQLQMTEGIEREVKGQKGETGHQLNKDTNYGPQNFNPF